MIGLGTARASLLPPPPVGAPCGGAVDDPCAPLRLADGRRLRVRPLRPADAAAAQAFVSDLSQQSRYRFHVGIQGVRHLYGDVVWDNEPMQGLVERLGGRLRALDDEPGVLRAWLGTAALSA